MYKRVIENLKILINLNQSDIEKDIYTFNSKKDIKEKKELRNSLYQSYYNLYINSLLVLRLFDEQIELKDISFNRDEYITNISDLVKILNQFDNIYRI
jgi:hypothetical protein